LKVLDPTRSGSTTLLVGTYRPNMQCFRSRFTKSVSGSSLVCEFGYGSKSRSRFFDDQKIRIQQVKKHNFLIFWNIIKHKTASLFLIMWAIFAFLDLDQDYQSGPDPETLPTDLDPIRIWIRNAAYIYV